MRELHHSNTGNTKATRSFTTATRGIEKRAGASPQQHGQYKSEQELHHSNTRNRKASKSFTTATRVIKGRAPSGWPRRPQRTRSTKIIAHIRQTLIKGRASSGRPRRPQRTKSEISMLPKGEHLLEVEHPAAGRDVPMGRDQKYQCPQKTSTY